MSLPSNPHEVETAGGRPGPGPTSSPRDTVQRPVAELGYSEAAAELDAIIAELDRGVVDVDLLETRLCRAVEIVEELDRRIRGARERVNSILPRLEVASRPEAAEASEDA